MTSFDLAAALEAEVRSVLPPDVPVFVDSVPDTTRGGYVALYIDPGTRDAVSVCGRIDTADGYPRMTCVHASPTLLRKVRNAALSVVGREVVADGAMARIEHSASTTPTRDGDIKDRVVWFTSDTLHLHAHAF